MESGPRESVIDGPLADVLVILKVIIKIGPGIIYKKIWSGRQLPNQLVLLLASINLFYLCNFNYNLNILAVNNFMHRDI